MAVAFEADRDVGGGDVVDEGGRVGLAHAEFLAADSTQGRDAVTARAVPAHLPTSSLGTTPKRATKSIPQGPSG